MNWPTVFYGTPIGVHFHSYLQKRQALLAITTKSPLTVCCIDGYTATQFSRYLTHWNWAVDETKYMHMAYSILYTVYRLFLFHIPFYFCSASINEQLCLQFASSNNIKRNKKSFFFSILTKYNFQTSIRRPLGASSSSAEEEFRNYSSSIWNLEIFLALKDFFHFISLKFIILFFFEI